MTFAARRAGEHLGRLSILVLVALLVVGGVGTIDALADRMLATGAERMLDDAEPGSRTIRVLAVKASDAAAQDEAVRAAIAAAAGEVEVSVARRESLDAAVLIAAADDGVADGTESVAMRFLDDPRIPALATLTAGAWPAAQDEVAVPLPAAERSGLAVGDTVLLARDGAPLTVVGLWSTNDPADPAWHGDPSAASGEDDGTIGPAVVAEVALSEITGTPTVTWEITPESAEVAAIPGLQHTVRALRALPDELDPQRRQNLRIVGGLGDTLQRQAAAVATTRGLVVAPLLIIALLGALVLGVVLTTLTTARAAELVLVRARGASGRALALGAAGESALAAAAGALLALAVLALTFGVTVLSVGAAIGVMLFAAIFAAVVTVRTARHADAVAADGARSDAGMRTLPVLLLPAGIALVLAVLAGWQLFATGAVIRRDGTADPVAAAAPALMLIAACALIPVLASPLAALAERLLRRTRGLAPILPLRQVARRMGGAAVAILCLSLAAASLALAVAAPAASAAAEQRARTALLGGDVRMIAADGPDTDAVTAETWPEVTTAADMLRTPVTIGSDEAVLVAGSADALGLEAPIPAGRGDAVPVVVTRSLVERLGAGEGTVLTARIRAVNRPVPIEIVGIVDALPGVGDGADAGLGFATDPDALGAMGVEIAPNELWLRSDEPAQTAAQLRAQAVHPVRILTAAQVSAAPVTFVAPVLLALGALVAAVLGLLGFFAASSAADRARREEPLMLRALGLAPARQRLLRIGETAVLAAYAVVAGALLGAAVAAAVLPVLLGAGS